MASPAATQKYRIRLRTKDGQEVVSQVIELISRDSQLKNPRWGDGKAPVLTTHGKELTMQVDAPGMDGHEVHFIVERLEDGSWTQLTDATAPVKGDVATAKATAAHPAVGAVGPQSKKDLAPVRLRFRVEAL